MTQKVKKTVQEYKYANQHWFDQASKIKIPVYSCHIIVINHLICFNSFKLFQLNVKSKLTNISKTQLSIAASTSTLGTERHKLVTARASKTL